jgi:hypothetical protein
LSENNNGAKVLHQITVRMVSNGQIQVNGPLQDSVLCYGLLEAAKDVIRRMQDQRNSDPAMIQVPTLVPRQ